MKKTFIIANWKSHMNESEALSWLEVFQLALLSNPIPEEKKVLLATSYPLLPVCKQFIEKHHTPLSLCAQDVSEFDEGAYTGEVSARLLKDFCQYVLIGHSERRKYFHETEEILGKKVMLCKSYQLMPILLIGNTSEIVPQGVEIVIYEPPSAISSSPNPKKPTPQEVERACGLLKMKNTVVYVLYGGSVGPTDVATYTHIQDIHGVIVGAESLNPESFIEIIHHA